jgi:hypothetical protein
LLENLRRLKENKNSSGSIPGSKLSAHKLARMLRAAGAGDMVERKR